MPCSPNHRSCYLFGQESLLGQCAETLLQKDCEVRAIVSDDSAIRNWATEKGLRVLHLAEQDQLLDLGSVDYLFSITHLKVIPEKVLALARRRAINFHDGPLPGYAGLNVPTWAIFNQEKEHGITWHELSTAVDRGDVLRQVTFPIDPNETALTLNAKCYSAVLDSFPNLLEDLLDDDAPATAQQGQSTVYGKFQRMPAMAVIDWTGTAASIHAMVRSLDYGPYWNPVNLPKIWLGDRYIYVRKTSLEAVPDAAPGMVIEGGSNPVVTTGQGAVRILEAVDASGEPSLPCGELESGKVLPAMPTDTRDLLSHWGEASSRHENYWRQKLRQFEPLYLSLGGRNDDFGQQEYDERVQSLDLEKLANLGSIENRLLQALLVIYLGRLCNTAISGVYLDRGVEDELRRRFLESYVPFSSMLDYRRSARELIASVCEDLVAVEDKGSYARELYLRDPAIGRPFLPNVLLASETRPLDSCKASLTLFVDAEKGAVEWRLRKDDNAADDLERFVRYCDHFLLELSENPDKPVAEIGLVPEQEWRLIEQWNTTSKSVDDPVGMHRRFEIQAQAQPEAKAICYADREVDYQTLNQRANRLAHYLLESGVVKGQLIGILLDRSDTMMVALLGVLKAGAAYIPLDPDYPRDRIGFMLDDSRTELVIAEAKYEPIIGEGISSLLLDQQNLLGYPAHNPDLDVSPESLAYMIYTSGTTGRPKGVMVEHGQLANFFSGMDDVIDARKESWLAVTSISFDISVLELFWTLANGFKVVIHSDRHQREARKLRSRHPQTEMKFSLFYWNVADSEHEYDEQPYRLLLESAKFGDQNGFEAIWTPERHFHAFGGLFPNPSVASAALATMTRNIQLRGGSCVVPLHHPARIAEEWAVVDNLSEGRVGIAMASGWQANDFVLMPQNHANAKDVLFENMEIIRKLWRGEAVCFDGPNGSVEIRTLPRPKQPELPIWVTTAGNPETFRMAGERGARILTHLLGQTAEGVAENIERYRKAYRDAGHEGDGYVTLLLHTLVGENEEEIKELAREPMKKYLKSAMFLVKSAAWHFPTFKKMSEETGQSLDEYFANISERDLDALLEFAFERYYHDSGLFGSLERTLAMVDRLKEIGVDEIGCLIDYGMETDTVLEHLPALNELRKLSLEQEIIAPEESIAELIERHGITHLQCTPSMAGMLLKEPDSANALGNLKHMLVGGEALSSGLAQELGEFVGGRITNMYGPTETTIWSTTQNVSAAEPIVPIGKPICNTRIYLLDQCGQPVPPGMAGEIFIGGSGVVRGYFDRSELTTERFLRDPFSQSDSARMYRTGDLGRYAADGCIEFLGRTDHQVKIRGYRIEPGEIEARLKVHEQISDALVVLRGETAEELRLVAYIIEAPGSKTQPFQLRAFLLTSLPEYMVPDSYVTLSELPLTPNGKLDRKALPEPGIVRIESDLFIAPDSDLAREISAIWSDVLEVSDIGMQDNFFALGGHSLTAIQVVQRICQAYDIDFPLQAVFIAPNLGSMVAEVERVMVEQVSEEDLQEMLAELED